MESIRAVERFAGAGGFRLGLEAVSDKFKVIWANQWELSRREQYAFDCYTAHFGNGKHHVCQDIAKAKSDVPDHDLLVGGFPCQDYSIMKKSSARIEGAKGVLWWQIDDILREKSRSMCCWKMWTGSFGLRQNNTAEISPLYCVASMKRAMP